MFRENTPDTVYILMLGKTYKYIYMANIAGHLENFLAVKNNKKLKSIIIRK